MKMKQLELCFENAFVRKSEYIGVLVEMQGFAEKELIINKRGNFTKKFEYYQSSYNDDLELKTFSGIKIVGFAHGSIRVIEKKLLGGR